MITPWISLVAATAAVAAAAPYTAALDDSKSRDDAVGGLQDEDVIDVGGESRLAPLGPGQPASHDHRRESRRRTLLVRQRQTPEGIHPRGQDRKPALGHVRSQGRRNSPDPRADADADDDNDDDDDDVNDDENREARSSLSRPTR